ncbi:MAG: iron-containing alcohol dehydrogenase, partial [Thermogladius sp.]
MRPFRLKHEEVTLYFGENSLEKAAWFLEGKKKVGVVTGRQSAKVSGALDDLLKILSERGVEYVVFSDVTPNPYLSQALRAGELFWRESVDAVVAVGGGSVID